MPDNDKQEPEDEFLAMLREMLSSQSGIDPEQLANAAGLPNDPELIAQLIQQLQSVLQDSSDEISWDLALDQAQSRTAVGLISVTDDQRERLEAAFNVASLWLTEATSISELTATPKLLTRTEWAAATMPVWVQLAEPVASSIADALTSVLNEQAPEEMSGMMDGASKLFRNVGGTLFAMQLGQVVGQLASEVVSGGDIGIPLLDATATSDTQAAVLPQNLDEFGVGLDISSDEIQLYLAVRELAHARLFRHAKWLRLQFITSITRSAQGISIDTSQLEELAANLDPSNPEDLRQAVMNGALIRPKTEDQLESLGKLETTLALVEGWVDVVTAQATSRLPRSGAIAETVRRRRAAGGPAESAFATLVGLELRPRRLREAAAMWQAVTDAVGSEKRDELWSHPDLVPTSEDIDNPQALIARLTAGEPELDDVDRAIEELLGDDNSERPRENEHGGTDEEETDGDEPDAPPHV